MKVAKTSPSRRPPATPARATLTLSGEAYRKIDDLRGVQSRSAWVTQLVDREEARLDRERFAQTLSEHYTPKVCRETLAINEEFPIHEA